MRKIQLCAAGLMFVASSAAFAGERQFTQHVQDLKPGQCAAASYVYESGELLKMDTGITKVCTTINGRSLWLLVDQKDLEDNSY